MDPKKVASTHGGEYCGPCPGCGGDDRFRIWPTQNNGEGSFFCRGCDKAGDRVTFLMEFDGMSYPEACRALDIQIEDQVYRTPRAPGGGKRKEERGKRKEVGDRGSKLPPEAWLERAEKLVIWSNEKLLENDEQLAWLNDRGIDRQTVETFRLGWNPGKDGRDLWRPRESWGLATELKENKNGKMVKKRLWIPRGLIIPLLRPVESPIRIRIRRLEREPRYYVLPGSSMDMMVLGDNDRVFLIVESELDAIMCHDLAGELCSVIGLGSSTAKPDALIMEKLRKSAIILLGLDYDAPGQKAISWWAHEFHQVKTWPVPDGGDPGEAYQLGCDIRQWVKAGLPAGLRIRGPDKTPVGRSVLDNEKKGDDPEKQSEKAGKSESEQVDAVAELAGLLKKHPVVIHNTPEQTYIAASLKWQAEHWDVYRRISRLVFHNVDVFRFISGYPARKITGKNIEPRIDANKRG